MKIFNLVIMKYVDYEQEKKNHKQKIERLEKNHMNYVGTLVDEKHSLENKIQALKKSNLDETTELESKISALESKIEEQTEQLESITSSNRSFKSSNTKLSNENKNLKNEIKNLKSELALSYKYEQIPKDRTKSKQVAKVKDYSRTSRIAKMMSR